MVRSLGTKVWVGVGLLTAVAIGIVLVSGRSILVSRTVANTNESAAGAARARYAAWSDLAWRQDQGQGSILMTATLLLPPTIAALGQDSERSDFDDQLYRAVRNLPADQVGIDLTLDSVAGPVADVTISQSLELSSADGRTWQLAAWQPLIRPSRVSNTNATISPQGGVAVFTADGPIDWATVKQLTLVSRGIGEVTERRFVWADPRLLLTAELE